MRRTRLSMKNRKAKEDIETDDDDESSNDVAHAHNTKPENFEEENKCDLSESSSDSDSEIDKKPTKELNLASSILAPIQISSTQVHNFEAIESNIFSDINRLSDTDSESETVEIPIGIHNFKAIEVYNSKLIDAKKSIEKYEAKKQTEATCVDINNLLAAGEKCETNQETYAQSSDYESYSDEEDWQEIKNENRPENAENENTIKDVEITVEMPGRIAKKKGVDLMACIKRRINRVKKDQQIYIHKVHLLCWIAHGNYVNKILNLESVQAIALSLLPSQHCYPSSRVDLTYLEQILTWYRKTIKIEEHSANNSISLEQILQQQMNLKKSHDKNVFVYIFICILRSLGVNVRLVMNVLAEPLRPPNSELCSLSNKPDSDIKDVKEISKVSQNTEDEKNLLPCTSGTTCNTLSSKVAKLCKLPTIDIELKSAESKNRTPKDDSIKSIKNNLPQTTKNVPTNKLNTKKIVNKYDNQVNTPAKVETKTRKNSGSSKNEKEIIEKKTITKREVSNDNDRLKNFETTKKVTEINLKRTSSIKKSSTSSKDDEIKNNGNKRLSERSVNNFPEKRKRSDEGINKKEQAHHSECEIINLAAKKDNKQISATHVKSSIKNLEEINPNKAKTEKNIPKRASISSSSTDNKRGGKKRKESINQVDGPNDSNDSDYSYDFVIPQIDGNDSSGSEKKTKPNLRKLSTRSQSNKNKGTYNKGSNESLKALQKSNTNKTESTKSSSQSIYFSSEKKTVDVKDDIVNLLKANISQEKQKRSSTRQRKIKSEIDSDSDSDFAPEYSEKKKPRNDYLAPKMIVKRRVLPRKELEKSALSDNDKEKKKKGVDIWVEVFLENEEKWISVDVLKGEVHCVQEIYTRASHPVSYILSWDNSSYIKDVTQRYCTSNWNTITRKLRVQPEWWSQSLKPFEGPKTARQREEDEELEQQQMDQPLPKVISEYKNHPLYALKRHLLKFEAIYPVDAPTVGFIRKEAVYSRLCVYTLHSREIWVKHAKVVKPAQTPYKIVKARPKYDKYSNTFITDKPLEIFGIWQVDDYIPPTAENGIVPKNAYGNVELFKKCMLPKGTVHLDLPGLQRVARKLNIDCPPAVVGFEFHAGGSHPSFEGFVVCEEFADILTDAWEQEQEIAEKRAQEKIDKRVYGNWRRLIKGLLIRERLQKRYDFAPASTSGNKKSKLILKKNRLCSDSDSE